MHSDITFIASDLLAAEKVQNILRESPCQLPGGPLQYPGS